VLKKYQDLPLELDELSRLAVDSIFHVHKNLGAGYPEKIYESALCYELNKRNIQYERQKRLKVVYPPDIVLEPEYRLDMVLEDRIILELKVVERVLPVHEAQLYSYMKMSGMKLGLLVNFNVPLIKDGIKRLCMK